MSKSDIAVILPSEEDGWEVWSSNKGVMKHARSIEGAVTKFTGQVGDCVAFSVCRVATLPMLVPSSEEEIFRGAAQLELENAGLLVDEEYQGWDCLEVSTSKENSFVSAIYLLEEELNELNDLRHYSFDYSARFYTPQEKGDCMALWKERHTWCLVFYRNNVPFLTEPLGAEIEDLAMTVNLLFSQLEVKGIFFQPTEVRLWSESQKAASLEQQFREAGLQMKTEPRPNPSIPKGHIELQPSEASAWQ